MTYSKLETLTRQAACEALGASIEGFDKWLDTYDTGEVMRPRGAVDYACVELTFNSSMPRHGFNHSGVSFYVSVSGAGRGQMHAILEYPCFDAERLMAKSETPTADTSDTVRDEDWIHTMCEFYFESDDEQDLLRAIIESFSDFLETDYAYKLCDFLDHFRN